jgi:hypothetical protein
MRSRGVVWVVAVVLAVTIGAGTAFAQAPVVPATTVAAHSGDQPKVDPKDGEDKPKVDKPNVAVPDVEAPKLEKSDVEAPKLEESGKATHDKANSEKPKPAPPKPKPAPPKPKPAPPKAKPTPQPQTPKQAQPKPAKPKPTHPKSAQPNEPGPQPQVDAAKSASPRPKAAPRVAASRIRHGTTRERPAPKESGKAARRPAEAPSPERSATDLAGSGRDSADATSATAHPLAATPILAPRLASDGAAASPSLDSQQPRVLILDARQSGYNATLLLAVVLTAGVAFLFGREVRRRPAAESRRLRRVPRSSRLDEEQSRFWHRRD